MNENNPTPPTQPPPPPHEVNPPSTNQVATHDQKPKKDIPWLKILVFSAVILITLIAFGLIAYLIMGNQNESKMGNDQSSIVNDSPTPTPDPTADWNVYIGEGFTFKYPTNWEPLENSEIIRKNIYDEASPSAEPIGSFDLVVNTALTEKIKEEVIIGTIFDQWPESTQEITINEYSALKITGAGGIANSVYNVGFAIEKDPNNSIIISGYTLNENLLEVLEKEMLDILSTLKFTDESEASNFDTSNWETHEGNDFSFNYPEDFEVQNLTNQYNQITNKNTNSVKLNNTSEDYYINIFSDSNSNNLSAKEILNNYTDRIYDPTDEEDPTGEYVYEKINNNLASYNNEKINGVYTVLGFDYNYETIIATNNNKLYIIQYSDNEGEKINKDQQNIVNQILSTLTFNQ